MLAARPQRGLVEQRVLVEVGVVGQSIGWRALAEQRPDRRPEDVREVEVDGPDRPMEVHVLVQEQARHEELLERAQARLVEGETGRADERVAPQPFGVDRPDRDAGQVRVASDVVEVVDREHAR